MSKLRCICGHTMVFQTGAEEYDLNLPTRVQVEKIAILINEWQKISFEGFFNEVDKNALSACRCPACDRLYITPRAEDVPYEVFKRSSCEIYKKSDFPVALTDEFCLITCYEIGNIAGTVGEFLSGKEYLLEIKKSIITVHIHKFKKTIWVETTYGSNLYFNFDFEP